MDRFQNTRQPDWNWWGKLWPTPGETLREFGLESGESVVEIGSGNGYFTLPAARIVAPEPVYALDLDETLLDELESLAAQQEISNARPVHGDARALAEHLPDPVDVALVANTFHGVDDRASVLEQIAAVLAEDGKLLILNWYDSPREQTTVADEPRGPPTELRLSPEETRQIVEEAIDVTLTRQIEIPPYHYGLVFER
ncbi:class I SAM-dependent methyltransferase [Halovenus halobia]|uniref:class I SAM-dependent methyltransferase n=1 Tax=Halovenus halobia TaxID=3396622 RepID=UPI003F555AD9